MKINLKLYSSTRWSDEDGFNRINPIRGVDRHQLLHCTFECARWLVESRAFDSIDSFERFLCGKMNIESRLVVDNIIKASEILILVRSFVFIHRSSAGYPCLECCFLSCQWCVRGQSIQDGIQCWIWLRVLSSWALPMKSFFIFKSHEVLFSLRLLLTIPNSKRRSWRVSFILLRKILNSDWRSISLSPRTHATNVSWFNTLSLLLLYFFKLEWIYIDGINWIKRLVALLTIFLITLRCWQALMISGTTPTPTSPQWSIALRRIMDAAVFLVFQIEVFALWRKWRHVFTNSWHEPWVVEATKRVSTFWCFHCFCASLSLHWWCKWCFFWAGRFSKNVVAQNFLTSLRDCILRLWFDVIYHVREYNWPHNPPPQHWSIVVITFYLVLMKRSDVHKI